MVNDSRWLVAISDSRLSTTNSSSRQHAVVKEKREKCAYDIYIMK